MEKDFSSCSTGICFETIIVPIIHINGLLDGSISLCKIFTDNTSFFSEAINRKKSEIKPNKDFKLISPCLYNWKIFSNPDHTKQATKVCFSRSPRGF